MFRRIYLSPNGRCSRRFYWQFFVAPMVVLGVLVGLFQLMFETHFAVVALVLVALWPSTVMQIKRLHDVDASGWWVLLSFVPYLNLFSWIVFGLIPGTSGDNRYGRDPLTLRSSEADRSNKTMAPTR